MNSEEAKNILQLCRPDHVEDINDPLITEAFEQLEQDSELCAWFEEQQILDMAIYAEFARIAPPQNLQMSILNGMQERAAQNEPETEEDSKDENSLLKPIELASTASGKSSQTSWFRPWMGIAAIFVFAGIFLVLPRRESTPQIAGNTQPAVISTSSTFTNTAGIPDLIQFLGQQIDEFNGSKFEKRSAQIDDLQSYLRLAGMPNPTSVPQRLEALPTIGCVTFDYNGTKLSMICFKNGQVYHLITANKADFDKDPLPNYSSSEAKFFEHKKQAFKLWSEGDQIYILSTEGTKEAIPEFI